MILFHREDQCVKRALLVGLRALILPTTKTQQRVDQILNKAIEATIFREHPALPFGNEH